jgi:hypothetical protein
VTSDVKEDGGLIGEDLLLNAEDGAMDLIVDVRQVTGSGALTHATELIIDGTVAQADPSLVGTEVRHGNAAQVSANGGAAEHWRVSSVGNGCLWFLIEQGGSGEGVGEVDFWLG